MSEHPSGAYGAGQAAYCPASEFETQTYRCSPDLKLVTSCYSAPWFGETCYAREAAFFCTDATQNSWAQASSFMEVFGDQSRCLETVSGDAAQDVIGSLQRGQGTVLSLFIEAPDSEPIQYACLLPQGSDE